MGHLGGPRGRRQWSAQGREAGRQHPPALTGAGEDYQASHGQIIGLRQPFREGLGQIVIRPGRILGLVLGDGQTGRLKKTQGSKGQEQAATRGQLPPVISPRPAAGQYLPEDEGRPCLLGRQGRLGQARPIPTRIAGNLTRPRCAIPRGRSRTAPRGDMIKIHPLICYPQQRPGLSRIGSQEEQDNEKGDNDG